MPLKFSYDQSRDVLTVEGVQYSGDFFRFFKVPNEGKLFRMVSIEDGKVTITEETVPAPLDLKKPAP